MTMMMNRQRQPDILLLRCEGKTTAPWLRYIITFVGLGILYCSLVEVYYSIEVLQYD